jgi:hypothetical protein
MVDRKWLLLGKPFIMLKIVEGQPENRQENRLASRALYIIFLICAIVHKRNAENKYMMVKTDRVE